MPIVDLWLPRDRPLGFRRRLPSIESLPRPRHEPSHVAPNGRPPFTRFFGYAAMVYGIIGRIRAELGEQARVVATGGLAETLAREVPAIEAVDGALTLTGLRLIWERNRPLA